MTELLRTTQNLWEKWELDMLYIVESHFWGITCFKNCLWKQYIRTIELRSLISWNSLKLKWNVSFTWPILLVYYIINWNHCSIFFLKFFFLKATHRNYLFCACPLTQVEGIYSSTPLPKGKFERFYGARTLALDVGCL